MAVLIAPNGVTTTHRPIVWRTQIDGAVIPSVRFARAKVMVNGAMIAELQSNPYFDPDFPGYYNFNFDVSGILIQEFRNPQSLTDTINYEFGYQVAYFAYSLSIKREVYLSIEYFDIDAPTNQEIVVDSEDTIEIAVFDTKTQTQERTTLDPYRFAPGMKPLTYRKFGGLSDDNMPQLEYSAHGDYLSFLFDGGVGQPFVSFQLRDAAPGSGGNYYGTGLARLGAPTKYRNVVTVSISPQNIKNFIFDSVTTSPDFIAALNTPNGWDRIGVAFGIAIPLGGGLFQHVTYGVFFYKVIFNTCPTYALYAKNQLGGFDAHLFDDANTNRISRVSSSKSIVPQKFDIKTLTRVERYRAQYPGRVKTKTQIDYQITLLSSVQILQSEKLVLLSLQNSTEVYTEPSTMPEFVDDTNLEPDKFLPVLVADGELVTTEDEVSVAQITINPANDYY